MNKSVYLAGPIEGLTWEQATSWRQHVCNELKPKGISCRNPMRYKKFLDGKIINSSGLNAKAIVSRDRFDVQSSGVILMNFEGVNKASLGSFVEIGWADAFRKPIILVLDRDNTRREHPFIKELAYCIVDNLGDALTHIIEILVEEN